MKRTTWLAVILTAVAPLAALIWWSVKPSASLTADDQERFCASIAREASGIVDQERSLIAYENSHPTKKTDSEKAVLKQKWRDMSARMKGIVVRWEALVTNVDSNGFEFKFAKDDLKYPGVVVSTSLYPSYIKYGTPPGSEGLRKLARGDKFIVTASIKEIDRSFNPQQANVQIYLEDARAALP